MIFRTDQPRHTALCLLIILVLGFTAYSFFLGAPFKTMDDNISIVNNPDIKDLANAKKIFASSYFGDNHYYRPMVNFSYMLEYRFFGLNPFFYNLTNLAIHLIIAVLVFFMVRALVDGRFTAFAASLLFAVHPVQWEPVANIAGRSVLLAGMFTVGAFLMFCLAQRRGNAFWLYAGSLVLAFFGLLSKESAAMLPALIFFYAFTFQKQNAAGAVARTLPYLGVILAYVLLRRYLGITDVYTWRSLHEWGLGVLTFLRAALTYLRLYVLPVDLHFDRSYRLFGSYGDPAAVVTALVYILAAALLIKYRKRFSPPAVFFFAWFWIELFPVSQAVASIGVQPGYISAAEHFLYVPSVGMFVLMALGFRDLCRFCEHSRRCSPRIAQLAGGGMIVFFMMTTVQQNLYARHTISMVKQSLDHNPHNARMLYSYAFEMARVGEFALAEEYFRRSLSEEAEQPIALIGLGKSLCDQGRYLECLDVYERVRDPGKFKELLEENLRLTYDIVIRRYRQKIEERPDDPGLHFSLGWMLSKAGRPGEALAPLEEAVKLRPAYKQALYQLASVNEKLGRKKQAVALYERMLKLEGPQDQLDVWARQNLQRIQRRSE